MSKKHPIGFFVQHQKTNMPRNTTNRLFCGQHLVSGEAIETFVGQTIGVAQLYHCLRHHGIVNLHAGVAKHCGDMVVFWF